MKFGSIPVAEAAGGIAVHSIRQDGLVLKKGDMILPAHIAGLQAAGIERIAVAQIEAGDVGEDEAAQRLATALAGDHVRVQKPFTGRSNLFATCAGVLAADSLTLDAINDIDESITVATLPQWRTVVIGEMIGTVKIIPFAVQGALLQRAVAIAHGSPIRVAAFAPLRVAVISTLLPGLKTSVIAKTLRVLEERLAPARATIVSDIRTPHQTAPLSQAIQEAAPQCNLLIIFGASAITDRRDVIPAALEAAGGEIEHFGMPVDPGNLLLIGRVNENGRKVHVLGAPGCARSPKENGFDWVLHRLLAGIDVTSRDIRRMGSGGLLMEIIDRGQLRDGHGTQADE